MTDAAVNAAWSELKKRGVTNLSAADVEASVGAYLSALDAHDAKGFGEGDVVRAAMAISGCTQGLASTGCIEAARAALSAVTPRRAGAPETAARERDELVTFLKEHGRSLINVIASGVDATGQRDASAAFNAIAKLTVLLERFAKP